MPDTVQSRPAQALHPALVAKPAAAQRDAPAQQTLYLVTALALLYLLLVGAAFYIATLLPRASRDLFLGPLAIAFGVHLVAGLVILGSRSTRAGARRIGWLMVTTGLCAALYIFALNYSTLAYVTQTRPPGIMLSDWFLQWGWLGYAWTLGLALPLFYPTGRIPSPRWAPLWWLSLALLVALWFSAAFGISVLEGLTPIPNPFAIQSWPWLSEMTNRLDASLNVVATLTLFSVFFRYRSAGAEVRAQMRWLLYLAAVFAGYSLILLTMNLLGLPEIPPNISTGIYATWVALVGSAVALAIVRYRLFDIDFLIRRTLVYAIVTALLALVYLGAVLLLQTLTIRITGQASDVAIALSTLAIAALFNPLRRRVQSWIDRRFYRSRYDAQRILADFAAIAQDEPDLARLTDELLRAISDTMHPTTADVWLSKGHGLPAEQAPLAEPTQPA